MDQFESILLRAKNGSGVNTEECIYLTRHMPRNEIPYYCKQVLKNAQKTGLLARRGSRIGQTWDLAEGHGTKMVYYDNVKGGTVDNPVQNVSVDEHYMKDKTPEQQEKIRALRTRMSARGALNIPGVNPAEVETERNKDVQHRESRRAEFKGKTQDAH